MIALLANYDKLSLDKQVKGGARARCWTLEGAHQSPWDLEVVYEDFPTMG